MSTSQRVFAIHGPHALVGKNVYTIFHGDSNGFINIPRPGDSPKSLPLVLKNIWQLGYVSNSTPFMPLVPQHRPFHGSLFSRLNYDSRTIPVHQLPNGNWALDGTVIRDWDTLERNLRALLSSMLFFSTMPLPRLFQLWYYPMKYGYKLSYQTYRQARFIALRSRDAFIPLMASLSFMLILMEAQEKLSPNFNWRDKVLGRSGTHYQWLAELELSAVGDLNVPRIGGIINLETCEFNALLPVMCKAKNMPLYIYWGPITSAPLRVPHFLSPDMVPDHRDISHLHSLAAQNAKTASSQPLSVPSSVAADVTPPNATSSINPAPPKKFPPVEPFSGQGKDEDWKSFFARRKAQDELNAARETPKAKQSRMARIEVASHHRPPGKKGARVYKWEEVDGFLVRRAVGRSHYEDEWSNYNASQRKYDSFRNEWDLCPILDPTGTPDHEHDDWDSWDNDENGQKFNFPLLADDNSEARPEGIHSSSADLQRVHSVQQDHHDVLIEETPDDLAFYRFGFVNPICPVATPSKKPAWSEVFNILGNGLRTPWAEPSSSVKDAMCTFFGHFMSAMSLCDVPADTYDLRSDERMASGRVSIRCVNLSNKSSYILKQHGAPDGSFVLILTSAATVMEIVRHGWGPDLQLIVYKLLERGIAFNFCWPDPPRIKPPPMFMPRFGGLGYRPKGYKPDQVDYAAYESFRNRLLQSSRGRAASSRGGLLARLARDVVTADDVVFGPSGDLLDEALCLWDGNHSSMAYWDDQLSADEEDLLCGLYQVDTGKTFKTHGINSNNILYYRSESPYTRASNDRCFLVAKTFDMGKFGSQCRLLVKGLRGMVSEASCCHSVRHSRSEVPTSMEAWPEILQVIPCGSQEK